MPVHPFKNRTNLIYQRQQYEAGGIGRRYWDFRDRMILAQIPTDASTILEAGCGEGILLEKLLKKYPHSEVSGLDIDEENITICRKYNLPVIAGDLTDIPWEDQYFDVITLIEVIEHLPEPEKAIMELSRILKQGGRLIVLFPNDLAFKIARISTLYWLEAFADSGHIRQYHPRSVKRMAEKAGFQQIFGRGLPFPIWPLALHYLIVFDKK